MTVQQSVLNVKPVVVTLTQQLYIISVGATFVPWYGEPCEGPSSRDYEPSCGPSFEALMLEQVTNDHYDTASGHDTVSAVHNPDTVWSLVSPNRENTCQRLD